MPLPKFTHFKYSELDIQEHYHIIYDLWDIQTEFRCECGKVWRSPSMSYAFGLRGMGVDGIKGLPLPLRCSCGKTTLIIFDDIVDIVRNHYENGQ